MVTACILSKGKAQLHQFRRASRRQKTGMRHEAGPSEPRREILTLKAFVVNMMPVRRKPTMKRPPLIVWMKVGCGRFDHWPVQGNWQPIHGPTATELRTLVGRTQVWSQITEW